MSASPTKPRSDTESTVAESVIISSPDLKLKPVEGINFLPPSKRAPSDVLVGEFIFATDVSIRAFSVFLDENSEELKDYKPFLIKGSLILIEVPTASEVHQGIIGMLGMLTGNYNTVQTNTPFLPLTFIDDFECYFEEGEETVARPDVVISLAKSEVPSLVIEVLYANGGTNQVAEYARLYLSDESLVEMFIALIVMYPGNIDNEEAFAAVAFVFDREHGPIPIQVVNFGTIDLHLILKQQIHATLGMPANVIIQGSHPQPLCSVDHPYLIEIPWNVFQVNNDNLVQNIVWVDVLNNHNLTLSLYHIQQRALLAFQRMRRRGNLPGRDRVQRTVDNLW